MDTTGKLTNITRDIMSGKLNVTFQIDAEPIEELNEYGRASDILDISVKKHRKKRSNDANGMLWSCLSDIAKAMNPPRDKWEVYLEMLKSYGEYTYVSVEPKAVETMKKQWRETEVVGEIEENGERQFAIYFFVSCGVR